MKIEKMKCRNSFISKGKYENRKNCEYYGISNGQTIPKFPHLLNFDSFRNFDNLLLFQVVELWKTVNFQI